MATSAAVGLVALWRIGVPGRAVVAAALAVQLAWGAGVVGLPTHAMLGMNGLVAGISHGAKHFNNDRTDNASSFSEFFRLGDALPKDARVLVHGAHHAFGIRRPVVTDWVGWQGLLDYRRFDGNDALGRWLAGHRITHLAIRRPDHQQNAPYDTLGGEARLFSFARRCAREVGSAGGFAVYQVQPCPPAQAAADRVLVDDCGKAEADVPAGRYRAASLELFSGTAAEPLPAPDEPLGADVLAVWVGKSCRDRWEAPLAAAGLALAGTRDKGLLFVR